jgi:hypothetical protein
MFKTLVEKARKHQIEPLGYHWKNLKVKMPKGLLHCLFKPNMHEL